MSTHKPIEELIAQHQEGKLSMLELVIQSEYGDEYIDWLLETGLARNDDTAFLFLEKKDVDAFAPENQYPSEPIQFELA